MQPRIFKRWLSKTPAPPRRGQKGGRVRTPTPEDEVRVLRMRLRKAERDERMDISGALTPPKIYMGGFTRPKDLRAANWFPGGPYVQKGKVYESPPEAAYEPHTVFLLETRYRVRHGVGRVDAKEHVTAVCRTSDFVKLVAKYNSPLCPEFKALESMDNACWPFIPKSGKHLQPTRWWGPGENPKDIMKELYEDNNLDVETVGQAMFKLKEKCDEDDEVVGSMEKQPPRRNEPIPPPESLQSHPPPPTTTSSAKESQAQEKQPPRLNEPIPPPESLQSHPPPPTTTSSTKESQAQESTSQTTDDIQPASLTGGSQQSSSAQQPSKTKPKPPSTKPPKLHDAPPAQRRLLDKEALRAEYMPRLATRPFWRPLLAITVSTRPLAISLSRLAKARERGLPFYAAMSTEDRKCLISFSTRMTNCRINRLLQLTRDMTMRLEGYKGGFIGIRFGVHERGRGIGGEGLADPIPLDKRVIKVQVANWYRRAEEVRESFETAGQEWGGGDAVDVSFMNDWGRRLDANGNEIPLTAEEMSQDDVQQADDEVEGSEENEDNQDEDEDEILNNPHINPMSSKKKLKPALRGTDEASAALRRKLAVKRTQKHRSVMWV